MAAGIFGASRVSGEGITIALASAALATFLLAGLRAAASGAGAFRSGAAPGRRRSRRHARCSSRDSARRRWAGRTTFRHLTDAPAAATAATAVLVLVLFGGASAHEIASTHAEPYTEPAPRTPDGEVADCAAGG